MGIKIFGYKVSKGIANRVRFFTIVNSTVSRELFFFFKDNYAPEIYRKSKLQKMVLEIINSLVEKPDSNFADLANEIFKKYNYSYRIEWSDKFKAFQKIRENPYALIEKRKLLNSRL